MIRVGLALVLLATVSGCVGHEMAEFEYCDPQRVMTETGVPRIYMRTPCVGWSDGQEVARYPERLPAGPYPPHKSLILYRNGEFVDVMLVEPKGAQ